MANNTKTEPEILINPTEKENKTVPETVTKATFNNLQQSFVEKCKQYDELTAAYRNLQMRYITDSDAAKHFVKTAALGLELLFPTQNKGGQR